MSQDANCRREELHAILQLVEEERVTEAAVDEQNFPVMSAFNDMSLHLFARAPECSADGRHCAAAHTKRCALFTPKTTSACFVFDNRRDEEGARSSEGGGSCSGYLSIFRGPAGEVFFVGRCSHIEYLAEKHYHTSELPGGGNACRVTDLLVEDPGSKDRLLSKRCRFKSTSEGY